MYFRKLNITFLLIVSSVFAFGQVDSLRQIKCISSPDTYNGQPVYKTVDQMPEYKGGMNELLRLLAKNVTYTDRDPNSSSVIHTTFIVDTLGKVQNVCTMTNKSQPDNQEKQIVQILLNAQNWTPGKLADKKVCVRITIPVRICLK